ncbi:hypothetical protein N7454_003254, partial [Penicillium verhagenii]
IEEKLKKFQKITVFRFLVYSYPHGSNRESALYIKSEEAVDLPKLEDLLSQEESENYSTGFRKTKIFVPFRSYPRAADKPPYKMAIGLWQRQLWPYTSGMPNPSTK